MMDTVLNLGLNDETVEAVAKSSGDRRFAYDSYRRFITMYSDVVLGVEHHLFEDILDDHKDRNGYTLDTDLTADDWVELVGRTRSGWRRSTARRFRRIRIKQLWGAIGAVFGSWMNQRAITYRRLHAIPESWGTAVNVQAMVFGNMGETSATGVAFTRNPSTGEKKLYGEFLINAQGEDVVAGIRTPQEITEAARLAAGSDKPSMEKELPQAFAELCRIQGVLERHYRDMQDLEFTVEQGKLWMLQTRSGKRTTNAALKIAVELAGEGVITRKEAVTRVDPAGLEQLLHPTIDPKAERNVIATGLPASPGAAAGEIVFSADEAETAQSAGPQGHPGAHRDLARRHPWHARVRGHPHHARRHDLACGGGCARHGKALRLGSGHAAGRLCGGHDGGGRPHAQGGRLHHRRRLDRTGVARPRADGGTGALRRLRDADGLGRPSAQAWRTRQCRHAERCPHRAQIRRRGHRAVPHRAHVLRGAPHPAPCAR